jgi:hypothetical protein
MCDEAAPPATRLAGALTLTAATDPIASGEALLDLLRVIGAPPAAGDPATDDPSAACIVRIDPSSPTSEIQLCAVASGFTTGGVGARRESHQLAAGLTDREEGPIVWPATRNRHDQPAHPQVLLGKAESTGRRRTA